MVHRLKGTLKTDLEALRAGQPVQSQEGTLKKAAPKKGASAAKKETSTQRKRKGKGKEGDEVERTPAKKGRKGKKSEVGVDVGEAQTMKEEDDKVKSEAESGEEKV